MKTKGAGNHSRLLVRIACLIAAVFCLLPISGAEVLLPLVPALSPFVSVASVLAAKTIRPILAFGFAVGFIALVRHRWFCRWVCPMGLCLEGVSWIGRRLNRKPHQTISAGRWLLALTLGGAILGFPLFLWFDPLSLFAGLFLLTDKKQLLTGIISLLIVTLLLVMSLLRPHLWCRGLCPLGAFQDLLAIMYRCSMLDARCSSRILNPEPRTQNLPMGHHRWRHPVARRTVLGVLAGMFSAGVLRFAGRKPSRPLRPPGAVEELTFKGLCTRCGNCIRSCPYNIIRRDTEPYSITGILTPVLTFDKDYCREDCIRCTQVCPSGALAGVDVKNKPDVSIGLARVDMKICLLGEDRECSACMRWCPYGAIHYVFSEIEYTLVPVIDPGKCNGCGACEKACPTNPRKAIRVFSEV
jgi:MauM/NapG family ferredoxin protein